MLKLHSAFFAEYLRYLSRYVSTVVAVYQNTKGRHWSLESAPSGPSAPRNAGKLQSGGTGGKSYHWSPSAPPPLVSDSIPSLCPLGPFQNLHPYPILSLNSESARSVLIPACWNWGRSRSQIRDFCCSSAQDSSSALQPGIVCASLCTCELLPHVAVFMWASLLPANVVHLSLCAYGWKVFGEKPRAFISFALIPQFLPVRGFLLSRCAGK